MSMFGQVSVKNNQYKFKGDFHHIDPQHPIRNADDGWKLLGVTNPRDMTYIHSYGGEAIFFESLGQGKLLATRCDNPDCEPQGDDLSCRSASTARTAWAETRVDRPDRYRQEDGHGSTPSWSASAPGPSTSSTSPSSSSISNSTAWQRS